MKKSIIFAVALMFFILSLCGCMPEEDHIIGTPVIKVVLKHTNEENDEPLYYIVDDKGHAEKTGAFTPDSNATVFYADTYSDFKLEDINGEFVKILTGTKGTDKNGNAVYADAKTTEIMQITVDTMDHDFFDLSVWCTEGKYFVFLNLNVNWQDPYVLNSYDTAKKQLTELYSWQSKDLTGITTDVD